MQQVPRGRESSQNVAIDDICVMYSLTNFDQSPLSFEIRLPNRTDVRRNNNAPDLVRHFVDWNKFDDREKASYNNDFRRQMGEEASLCSKTNCGEDHTSEINAFYDKLINAMTLATDNFQFSKKRQFKILPDWNDMFKEKHATARRAFLEWRNVG